jgi:cytochrome c
LAAIAAVCASAVLIASPDADDVSKGKQQFDRRCSGCHALDRDKEGPRLGNAYGRVSGGVPTFTYSDALKDAHITWDTESLDKWLTDPARLVPDSDMAIQVRDETERRQIIAYLKHLSKQ